VEDLDGWMLVDWMIFEGSSKLKEIGQLRHALTE